MKKNASALFDGRAATLCGLMLCLCACADTPPIDPADQIREIREIGGRIFEKADWNVVKVLNHNLLVGPDWKSAFASQSVELDRDTGGYLCAGTATYLSRVLEDRGYKTAIYDSGASSASHVVTLVDTLAGLYFVDSYTGTVAPRFDDLLKALMATDGPDFPGLLQPMDAHLRKEVLRDARGRTLIPRAESRSPEDGSVAVESGEPRMSDCRVTAASLLLCVKPPGDYQTFLDLDRGIETATGVTNGLFTIPLYLHTEHRQTLFEKYPFLEVLDRYSSEFRAADVPERDRSRYARLVADVHRELKGYLVETPYGKEEIPE